jgi:hypothetical protein
VKSNISSTMLPETAQKRQKQPYNRQQIKQKTDQQKFDPS